jgi:transcriptional regulator with AAA-type ATPase domain
VPAPADVEAWLSLWVPELAKPATAVVVENVDLLPAWAAQELQIQALRALRSLPGKNTDEHAGPVWAVTARELEAIPQLLAGMIDSVVCVPALRERVYDVLKLARYAASQSRVTEMGLTSAAEKALMPHSWPENIDELFTVIHAAAARTETIDLSHLPTRLIGRSSRQLSPLEALERNEIVRCLSIPGMTVSVAAAELGISRATIYRRMARLGIAFPK